MLSGPTTITQPAPPAEGTQNASVAPASPLPGALVDAPVEALLARMRSGDREAAAAFVTRYGALIRRRVRGKLGAGVRRLFDSQDIMSTVGRRLDRYVRNGRVDARDESQLWNLVYLMAETAVIDKVRAVKRLDAAEGDDEPLARLLVQRLQGNPAASSEEAPDLERVYWSLGSDAERELLTLWLADMPLFRIAECLGVTPAAVRQRWKVVRDRLRAQLEAGTL